MKKTFFIAGIMAAMCACNLQVPEEIKTTRTLDLSVKTSCETKALVTDSYLADGESIGIYLTDMEGVSYDNLSLNNYKYTATGTGESQTWKADTEITLSETTGQLYAYYPYDENITDMSAIAIDNTKQTDWMYATAVQDLNNMNYKAQITLNHALAAVKIVLKKGAYDGAGNVTAVTVSSEGFAQTAVLNAKTGELSGFGETNTAINLSDESFTLTEEGRELVTIVIPTGEAEPIKIKTTIDGNEYETQTNAISLENGCITSYETKSTTNDFKITKVGVVTEWTSDEQGSIELQEKAPETANCYIISEAGDFSFPTVKGNSSESVGAVASAKVVWESYGTAETINVGDLVSEAIYEDGKIKVTTTGKNGNAVVAACDASGNILWSWHLWMTDETIQEHTYANGAGVAMDRNLGALSATPGDVGAFGVLYQWGRKDPFLASASISENTEPAVAGTAINMASDGTLDLTILNPSVFYQSYYADNTSWGEAKTIYDPCPAGWKVPDINFWQMEEDPYENEYWDTAYMGINIPTSTSGVDAWYPASGGRISNTGMINNTGNNGLYWSTANKGTASAYYMRFTTGSIYPSNSGFKSASYSVRAVRE